MSYFIFILTINTYKYLYFNIKITESNILKPYISYNVLT